MADKIEIKGKTAGYKSTEFWLSVVATVLGIVVASGAFGDESQAMKICGLGLSVLATLGYTGARAGIKKEILNAESDDGQPNS